VFSIDVTVCRRCSTNVWPRGWASSPTYHGAIETERVPCREVRRFDGVTLEQIEDIDDDIAYVFAAR